jgi:hypothetical protein
LWIGGVSQREDVVAGFGGPGERGLDGGSVRPFEKRVGSFMVGDADQRAARLGKNIPRQAEGGKQFALPPRAYRGECEAKPVGKVV